MREYDPILEAEGVLEDPRGEIEAPLAGVGRRFFNAVSDLEVAAELVLGVVRGSFAYTVDYGPSARAKGSADGEGLRMLLFVEDELTPRYCRIAQPILASAGKAAGLIEVGIVRVQDESLLLLIPTDFAWSEGEIAQARSRLWYALDKDAGWV